MNESRQQQMLAGQSSIAQKVFGHVPIQARWSARDIHGAVLAANASGASAYAVRRALGELKDAGLIREPIGGKFQRDVATSTARLDDGGAVEFAGAAGRTVLDIRAGIIKDRAALKGLQEYVREVCQ